MFTHLVSAFKCIRVSVCVSFLRFARSNIGKCIYTHTHANQQSLTEVHVKQNVYIYIHMYIWIHIFIQVYINSYIYQYMCLYVFIYIYTNTCVYTHLHIYTYMCIKINRACATGPASRWRGRGPRVRRLYGKAAKHQTQAMRSHPSMHWVCRAHFQKWGSLSRVQGENFVHQKVAMTQKWFYVTIVRWLS